MKNSYTFKPIHKTACILWIWTNLRLYLGALTWKGSTEMCCPQDCLFTPLMVFTRPPVEAQVHSQDPYLEKKCDISPPKSNILRKYEAQIRPQVSSKSLKIVQNISSKAPVFFFFFFFLMKICSRQFICSQAPKFGNPCHTYLPGKKIPRNIYII